MAAVKTASFFVALGLHPDAVASRTIALQCFAYIANLLCANGTKFSGDDLSGLLVGRSVPIEAASEEAAQIVAKTLSRIPGVIAGSFSLGVEL